MEKILLLTFFKSLAESSLTNRGYIKSAIMSVAFAISSAANSRSVITSILQLSSENCINFSVKVMNS